PPTAPPFPYTTLFRSRGAHARGERHRALGALQLGELALHGRHGGVADAAVDVAGLLAGEEGGAARDVAEDEGAGLVDGRGVRARDRKSTRLNSSHVKI